VIVFEDNIESYKQKQVIKKQTKQKQRH
jgi:hypothetical protein